MKLHGRTFFALGLLQYFWYHSDKRREQFVEMCKDEDVQTLTWQAYHRKAGQEEEKEHCAYSSKTWRNLRSIENSA